MGVGKSGESNFCEPKRGKMMVDERLGSHSNLAGVVVIIVVVILLPVEMLPWVLKPCCSPGVSSAQLFFLLFHIYNFSFPALCSRISKHAYAVGPAIGRLGIDQDLVGERIGVGGGDGGNVVLVAVDDIYNLEGGFVEGHFHGSADFEDVYGH